MDLILSEMVAMKMEIRRLSSVVEANYKFKKGTHIGRGNNNLDVFESFGYPVKTTASDVSTIIISSDRDSGRCPSFSTKAMLAVCTIILHQSDSFSGLDIVPSA